MNNRLAKLQTREHLNHLERVFWIDQEIRANRYPSAAKIAEHFEVSSKTAQRTLDFMRDRLRLPIAYSAEHRGWYYTEPSFALPAIELTEGDLVAILLSERLIRQYKGLAIGNQVQQAFAKVLKAMTNSVSIDFGGLAEAHSFEPVLSIELEPTIFQQLGSAVIERRKIKITYYSAQRGLITERDVKPLHLRNYLGEWYLIAFDHLRNEVRDFHAGRIRELVITDETFEWPEGFDLSTYLNKGFSMIRGISHFDVDVVFDEFQARWIRERPPIHPTEQREELPGGSLRIKMRVTALDGVKRFVMQYGAHAKVISPPELIEAVQSEISQLQKVYNNGN